MIVAVIEFWTLAFFFFICEPGERVTNQFEQFHVEFGRCEWTILPIEMQRMYLIFLSDTQQPTILQSYAGISRTRETFKKVHLIENSIELHSQLYWTNIAFLGNNQRFFILYNASQVSGIA